MQPEDNLHSVEEDSMTSGLTDVRTRGSSNFLEKTLKKALKMLAPLVFPSAPVCINSNIQMKLHGQYMLNLIFMAPEFVSIFLYPAQENFLCKGVL